MKRKFWSFQLAVLLLGLNLSPVISLADELTPSKVADTSIATTKTTETTGESSTTQSSSEIPTETTDSSTTESNSTTPSTEVPKEEPTQQPTDSQNVSSSNLVKQPQSAVVTPVTSLPETGSINAADQEIKLTKNEATETFIKRIGEKARTVGQKNNIYASVMIAQAVLESGAGNSQLSQEPYYNLFGIKGAYEGESVNFATQEDDGTGNLYTIDSAFKKYPSYKEAFEDYAKLIKEGIDSNKEIYTDVWKENATTYKEATKALTGVYATDTNYDKKLNAFIEEYELTEYDKEKPSTSTSGIIVADSHPDSEFPEYSGQTYTGSENYAAGNCTQYVYNRIVQLDGSIGTTMGNGMDWAATGKANGYDVSNTPKAGTAVSFQPKVAGSDSTYGHVAFVEHVYQDGSILISEMNAAGLGVVSFRVIDSNTANTLAYITPK